MGPIDLKKEPAVALHQEPPGMDEAGRTTRTELRLEVGLASDVGPVRKVNEDRADFRVPEDRALSRAKGAIFVVADGMGGHQAGDVASRQAVAHVVEQYYADNTAKTGDRLIRIIKAANHSLFEEASSDPSKRGMGTTMVAVIVLGHDVYVANVGDSRAYILDDQDIVQITEDHSWVEEQVQAGRLSREEAQNHPHRNVITRALGSRATVEVDLFEGDLRPGEALLLCTDGLSNSLTDLAMARIIRALPASDAARLLVQQAAEMAGDDNATALVIKAPRQDTERM